MLGLIEISVWWWAITPIGTDDLFTIKSVKNGSGHKFIVKLIVTQNVYYPFLWYYTQLMLIKCLFGFCAIMGVAVQGLKLISILIWYPFLWTPCTLPCDTDIAYSQDVIDCIYPDCSLFRIDNWIVHKANPSRYLLTFGKLQMIPRLYPNNFDWFYLI